MIPDIFRECKLAWKNIVVIFLWCAEVVLEIIKSNKVYIFSKFWKDSRTTLYVKAPGITLVIFVCCWFISSSRNQGMEANQSFYKFIAIVVRSKLYLCLFCFYGYYYYCLQFQLVSHISRSADKHQTPSVQNMDQSIQTLE